MEEEEEEGVTLCSRKAVVSLSFSSRALSRLSSPLLCLLSGRESSPSDPRSAEFPSISLQFFPAEWSVGNALSKYISRSGKLNFLMSFCN